MLTIKNRPGLKWAAVKRCGWEGLLLAVAVALAGCAPPGPRALLKGKQLLDKGHYDQAVEKLKVATDLLSTNAQAWNYLGLACHYAGMEEDAQKAYQTAFRCDPDLSEAHFNLGCLWLAESKVEAAKGEFTAYTLRRDKSIDGLFMLGLAQLRAHESGDYRTRTRELNAADRSFNEVLQLDSKHFRAWNGLGLVRVQQGRIAEAMQYFSNAAQCNPAFAAAVLNQAIVAQQNQRDLRLALQKYREYLALHPPAEAAEPVNAQIMELEGGGAPSVAHLPATSPTVQPHVVTNSARVRAEPLLVATNRSGAATNVALEAEGNHAPRLSGPRYAYRLGVRLGSGNHAEAQRAFAQGLQAQQLHRPSEALSFYHQAAELDPAFFEAQYNLGAVAVEMGNMRQALTAYENALLLRFDSLDARYNFALALQRANYLVDAANELEKILTSSPNEVRAHLALANLYAGPLHQPGKARYHYQKVLETDPHNSQSAAIRKWLAENS